MLSERTGRARSARSARPSRSRRRIVSPCLPLTFCIAYRSRGEGFALTTMGGRVARVCTLHIPGNHPHRRCYSPLRGQHRTTPSQTPAGARYLPLPAARRRLLSDLSLSRLCVHTRRTEVAEHALHALRKPSSFSQASGAARTLHPPPLPVSLWYTELCNLRIPRRLNVPERDPPAPLFSSVRRGICTTSMKLYGTL